MSAPPTARLLTIEQALDRLNLTSRQTLANWRSNGVGPVWVKISGEIGRNNGAIRYPEDELEKYIADRTVRPGEAA